MAKLKRYDGSSWTEIDLTGSVDFSNCQPLNSKLTSLSNVSGSGFLKISNGTISTDTNTYLTISEGVLAPPTGNGYLYKRSNGVWEFKTGTSSITSVDGLTGGTISSATSVKGTLAVKDSSDNTKASLDQNGYVIGTWLQSTLASDKSDWTDVWVNSGGWLYKRAKASFKSDLGIPSTGTIATTSDIPTVPTYYEHNIRVYYSSYNVCVTFKFIDKNSTAYTYSTLAQALYNRGFTGSSTVCPATGFYGKSSGQNMIIGVYGNSTSSTTLYCRCIPLVSYSSSTATINNTISLNSESFALSSSYTINDVVRTL